MIADRRASRWWWLAATAVVFLADIFLHLPVTDFCDWLAVRYGFTEYDRAVRAGFLVCGAGAFAAIWLWPSGYRLLVGLTTTVLVALTLFAHKLIVVNAVESIHYPQYALIVLLLAPAVRNLPIAWIASTILGAIDEGYQARFLPRGAPDYFDWNDVVLNAIGAALGVVLVVTFTKLAHRPPRRLTAAAGAVAIVGFTIALLASPPVWSPFLEATPGGRFFHRVSASEAVAVLLFLYALVTGLSRKVSSRIRHTASPGDPAFPARPR